MMGVAKQPGPLREEWSRLLILAAMIVTLGRTLVGTRWAEGLEVVTWAGLGGLIVGAALGWSVFSCAACHPLSIVYGLAWIGYLLGRLLPGNQNGCERTITLIRRFAAWFDQAITGGIGRDTLVFVALLSGLAWIGGYIAAWNTYRRTRIGLALAPLSTMMLAIAYYAISSARTEHYLAWYAFLVLLFVARARLRIFEERWHTQGIPIPEELRSIAVRASAVAAALTVALAWVLPPAIALPRLAALWRRVSSPWEHVREEWQRLFSTVRNPSLTGLIEPFGPSLTLDGPRETSDTVVMDILAPPLARRYYWRGAVYDTYLADHWEASGNKRVLLLPSHRWTSLETYTPRRTIVATVTNYIPGRTLLVAPGQWAMVNREAEGYAGFTDGIHLDLARIVSVLPLQAGESYLALSYVSEADVASLRSAGAEYPEWVQQRYLQLPRSLPSRVCRLAEIVTAGLQTPYDQAVALERYLRRTIVYDTQPPERPSGRDYVDFLLFESHRGYCNGYATAMVIMARCLGIPARLAVGYAQGEYDPARGTFRVREGHAHAWPELYFPTYGWIEFEPTASETLLVRPERSGPQQSSGTVSGGAGRDLSEEEDLAIPPESADIELSRALGQKREHANLLALLGGIAVGTMGLAVLGWWLAENYGLRDLSSVDRAYARLLRIGRWLGHPLHTADTPWEWGQRMATHVPAARPQIEGIIALYQRARFGRGALDTLEACALWQQGRWALWSALFRLPLPFRKRSVR